MNESANAVRRIFLILLVLVVGIGAVWGWTAANKWTKDKPVRELYAEVDNLFEAFHQFKVHVGSYPIGNNVEIARSLLEGNNPKKIVILAVKKAELNAKGEIVDPWGTPLKIYFANNEGKSDCMILLRKRVLSFGGL